MPHDPDQLLQTFFDEAGEHLAALERGLLRVGAGPTDPDLLNAVFRAAHSIKGGSGVFGFDAVARLTHALEQLLDRMRKGQLAPAADRIDLLLRGVDGLGRLLTAARDGGGAGGDAVELLAELERAAGCTPQTAPTPAQASALSPGGVYRVSIRPGPDLFANGADPQLLLRNLAKRAELSDVVAGDDLPDLWSMDPERCYLRWDLVADAADGPDAIEQPFTFVADDCELHISRVPTPGRTAGDGVRPICEHPGDLPWSVGLFSEYSIAFQELAEWTEQLPALRGHIRH